MNLFAIQTVSLSSSVGIQFHRLLSFCTSLGHLRITLGSGTLPYQTTESSQPVLGVSPTVELFYSMCIPLFCLNACVNALRPVLLSVSQTPLGGVRALLLQQEVGCAGYTARIGWLLSGSGSGEPTNYKGLDICLSLHLLLGSAVPLETGTYVVWSQQPQIMHWFLPCLLTLAEQPGHSVHGQTPSTSSIRLSK